MIDITEYLYLEKEFIRGEIIDLNDTKLGFDFHDKKIKQSYLKSNDRRRRC